MGFLGQLVGLTGASATPETAYGTPSENAPLLSWEGDGAQNYLEIDCIPTLTDSRGGTVTDFALEDGASVADHFIRKPQTIKLEVNQTRVPIVTRTNPNVEDAMKQSTVDLVVEPSKFQATGLLLLTTGAIGLVKSATNAIGGALGLGEAFPGPPPLKARVLTATTDVDRINALYDDLTKAYESSALFSFDWLGRSWTNLVLTNIDYTRAAGRILGVFSLSLTHVTFVKTAQAQALQIPAEFGMLPNVPAGNKPGKTLTGAEKQTAIDHLPA